MSVIAIFVQPDRAKPFATAAPMPTTVSQESHKLFSKIELPVPPAPVMMATPGSRLKIDAIVTETARSLECRQGIVR